MNTQRTCILIASLIALTANSLIAGQSGNGGAVYVATNSAQNEVLLFERFTSGRLDGSPQAFSTGGAGTGGSLGNQGGLVISSDQEFLFVVNARSNQVSVFKVVSSGLELRDVASSGGRRPISLALHDDLLFVLHAGGLVGGTDQIVGFSIGDEGHLEMIPGSVRGLSATSTDPAQIGFTHDGSVLVVTEKATSGISTFLVECDGNLDLGHAQASAGLTPFGFAFGNRHQLFVAEAFGGHIDASAMSSYVVTPSSRLTRLDPSEPTRETAACWVALSNDARFAYTTNTGSDSVSGFAIGFNGDLSRLDSGGVTAQTGDEPSDMDFSIDGRFLYVRDGGDGTIRGFEQYSHDGSLTPVAAVGGLPEGSNGLVAQ